MRPRFILAALCTSLVLASCRKPAPESPVHFAREEIAMDVGPGTLEVRGMYHFKCSAKEPLVASVFYPFPLDSTHLYPDSIEIRTPNVDHQTPNARTPDSGLRRWPQGPLSDNAEFAVRTFTRQDSGVAFRMRFRPNAEDSFVAYYRQPLRANSATYIVTTTRKWRRPIDVARFRVTVPAVFKDVELTFKPDSVVRCPTGAAGAKSDSTISYFFTRKRFYPDRDITVTWR